MTTSTANLNLISYNSTTDASLTFLSFRTDIAGVTNSNLTKLDSFAGRVNASLITLDSNKPIVFVYGTYSSPNYYVATTSGLSSYVTGQIIDFSPSLTTNGTVTLNINSYGTKTMVKTDDSGAYVNFSGGEMGVNKHYIFRYDGTQWVWISGTSGEYVYVTSGSKNEIVVTGGSGSLVSTGITFSSASAIDSFVVSGSAGKIDNGWLRTGAGNGIDADTLDTYHLADISSGWFPAGETWTYASASTFTISGDVTGKYQVGDKIKLTQTTVKYFYIIGVTYSSPNTIITITGGTDYIFANAVVTNNYYTHIENPIGFPDYLNHTATFAVTGGSIGNGSCAGIFKLVGKMCFFHFLFQPGTTTNFGSGGAFSFSLPITVGAGRSYIGQSYIRKAGTSNYIVQSQLQASVSVMSIFTSWAEGTNVGTLTNTVPAAWSDIFSMITEIWYGI